MEPFFIIVLVVAVVFLIAILTIMGVMMQSQNKSVVYPPTVNRCPDYWTEDVAGTCTMSATQNRGDYSTSAGLSTTSAPYATSGTTFDPSNNQWSTSSGKTAICAKRDWAMRHNIVWDGVSNYNNCTVSST
jgi:hypothetical protein